MPHNTDDTGYSRAATAPTPDLQYAHLLTDALAWTRTPSRPKAMIDAFLDDYRFHTILDAEKVKNLLLDLRAEV